MQATKNSGLEAQLVVLFLFLLTRVFSSSSFFCLSVFFFCLTVSLLLKKMTKFDKNWRGNRSLTLKNEKKNEGYSSYGDLFFFFC